MKTGSYRRLPRAAPRCPSAYLLPGEIPISCKLSEGHDGLHRDDGYRWAVVGLRALIARRGIVQATHLDPRTPLYYPSDLGIEEAS